VQRILQACSLLKRGKKNGVRGGQRGDDDEVLVDEHGEDAKELL
jgi:hypothetical protein